MGAAGEPLAGTHRECPAQRQGNTPLPRPPSSARPSVHSAARRVLLADGAAPAGGAEVPAQGAAPANGAMPTQCAAQADVAALAVVVAPAKVAPPANIGGCVAASATAPSDPAGEAKR